MGLFGGKKDDVLNDWSNADLGALDPNSIDFSKYDLTSLGDDVRSIVSLPDAMLQTAKWGFGVPVVIGIVSWFVFASRMPTWVLVPFVFAAVMLSVLGSILIGGFFVARKRLDTVSTATARVVGVVGDMHTDVVQIKDGASTTSVKAVATGLLQHAIFPVAFGFVEGMAPTGSKGPLGRVTSKFSDVSMNLVQRSVISAVERLPDKEIGQLATDLTADLPEISAELTSLNDEYQRIAGEIEGVVGHVSKATLGSMIGAAALAMVPLLCWLAIGWIAS